MKRKKKILISSYHMNLVLKNYSSILKNNNILYDKIVKNPSVNEDQLLKVIEKYDGLICSDDEITKKVLDKAVNLKVISKWGTGIDSINKNYAKQKKIKVCNTPNAFSRSVGQLTWAMILSLSRKMMETHKMIQQGDWPKLTGISLEKKNLGIIGLGNVGQTVIKMGVGFDMNILGSDTKSIKKNILQKLKIKKVSKKELIKKSDVIVLCVDLNKNSYDLISDQEFNNMKKDVILINISRGPVINEKSLIKALKKKKIGGLGIDVFTKEPLNKNNYLVKAKNCILSSHNAFNTSEQVEKVHKNTIMNIVNNLK